MVDKDVLIDLLMALLVFVPVLAFGVWRFERGLTRARSLLYRWLPAPFLLVGPVMMARRLILGGEAVGSFGAELVFAVVVSAISAGSVILTIKFTFWLRGIDVDSLDKKRHRPYRTGPRGKKKSLAEVTTKRNRRV